MADITYNIKLYSGSGDEFSSSNYAGAEARLRNSNSSGTNLSEYTGNSGSSGAFTEEGHGTWSIGIDEEDSGYFLIQTKSGSGSWTNVDGKAPTYIQLEEAVDIDSEQTVTGAKTFSGACEVSGNWDVSGEIDFASNTLKYGSTAYDISLLGQTAKGTVDSEKAVVVDSNKDVDFGVGGVSATNLTATGILLLSGSEAVTGNVALDLAKSVHLLDTSGGALPSITLNDGTEGQIKIIYMDKSGNNAVVTPDNLHNNSTLTFDAVDEVAILIFLGSNWYIISSHGVTIA